MGIRVDFNFDSLLFYLIGGMDIPFRALNKDL